ncbi:MAG: hypothetical protein WCH85_09625 [Methanomicrobiales archaeon]
MIDIFRMLTSAIMSTKARGSDVSGNPVVASRNKTQLPIGRDEEAPLNPFQRMQGKILLADPEMARRIIFDPSLES